MKIGPLENKTTLPVQGADRKAASGAGSAGKPEPSAKVELSAAASVLAGQPDGSFDAQKVERIGRAIREGRYVVDPQAIADQLLAHTREMLTPKAD